MGVNHSKQSCDISSTPKKKGEANGKAPVEEIKSDEKITVNYFFVAYFYFIIKIWYCKTLFIGKFFLAFWQLWEIDALMFESH